MEKQTRELAEFLCNDCGSNGSCECKGTLCDGVYRQAALIINAGYRKDTSQIKTGKWRVAYRGKQATVFECSECGHLNFGTSAYCICGASMIEE